MVARESFGLSFSIFEFFRLFALLFEVKIVVFAYKNGEICV